MEFTSDLMIFEGYLDSANDVITIADIQEKSGHEHEIKYLLDCIRKYLTEVGYIDNGKDKDEVYNKVRQLALYVIFNSDLKVIAEMREFEGLELFFDTLPLLPRYVLCEILWYLDIDEIIGEILVYSYPLLALDVAESLIDHCKYFVPHKCLKRLGLLAVSSYKILYRMIYFDINEEIVIRAYNNFQRCVNFFVKQPNIDNLDKLGEDELYRFKGEQLHAYLLVVYECLNVFAKKEQHKPMETKDIFLSTMKPNVIKLEDIYSSVSHKDMPIIQNCLLNSNNILLDVCKCLVSEISVDIFCSWSEFEENGISLQNTIGEMGYRISTDLFEYINKVEPLYMMLQHITLKPKDFTMLVNEVDNKTIEENIIEGNHESVQWLKALVYRDNLCNDNKLLTLLQNKIDLLNNEECHRLYNILHEHLSNEYKENEKLIKSLIIKLFELCTNDIKHKLVAEHFCNNSFNNTLVNDTFESAKIEVFNKLISSPDYDLTLVYVVFLQDPMEVLKEIFNLASKNDHQSKIMINVLTFLESYKNHRLKGYNENCVLWTAKETINNNLPTDKNRNYFIKFLSELKHKKIISELDLLFEIIMPNIHCDLKNENLDKLNFYCKLLIKAYNPFELIEYIAPILVILAQVAQIVRWKINTFTSIKPIILDTVIELIISFMNTYNSKIPEKDLKWLTMKLKGLNQLNMYYYRCLWNPPGDNFIDTISGSEVSMEMDQRQIVLWLSQQFCSTSLQEWYKIWHSLELFECDKVLSLFHEAIITIVLAENANRTEQTEACLLYCFKNYICIIKNKFLILPKNEDKMKTVIKKIVALENSLQVSNIQEIEILLMPLFAFIAEQKTDYNVDLSANLQRQLKHIEIKNMCARFF